VSRATFGSLPWRSRSQRDLAAKSCPAHNFVIWSENISQKWSQYWDDVLRATFRLLPWRSRSQHDLAAKLCPAKNFVIWSRFLQLLHMNDHHIETTCRAQHLGHYLEGQGHSMTLTAKSRPTHNFVIWSRILKILQKHDHYIETMCPAQHLGLYIEGQGHRPWPCIKIDSTCCMQHLGRYLEVKVTAWPLAKLFTARNFVIWSRFKNYLTWMISILRRCFECNI